ncbi:alpha-amylase family protein [Agromyces marinus]|uniref:Alpha-amylase n=1 Tax=Agromyces marinus TaxID=1389020 RepID=A0ABN6YFE2_9MICO|nr:alpha-amylase family protein [Agromyces marinus]UIP58908.1 Trehalose synthase/amylase TreS [Agromyces marinus]BDZ56134.1 alpha-amylase [Agromyces marinus]
MRATDRGDLWWKTAVVYCLDVETYMDWNDDGSGDFEGLANRLDHLAELGVTCIWLMPFQPSPDQDDGYDIVDFLGVDPRLGSLGDVVAFTRAARDRGIRVIMDLVMNHTSDRHPWFVSAKRGRNAPYRDFYVWRDEIPPNPPESVFPGEEEGVWEWHEGTGQYYLHSFYRHQPDLNIANPEVRDEVAKTVGFWLELGFSGFRVDAVPFLIEPPAGVDVGDPHELLRDLRRYLQRRASEAILLGEVNLPYEQQIAYFGADGDPAELTLQFDFEAMQRLYLSLARQDATALRDTLAKRPRLEPEKQWANFVRNHDELTLDKLSDAEREEVFDAFAPEEWMRVYGRGIVRRLPPMLEGDPRRVRMVYSLLFALPGTPVLFYGEEIGMGENGEQEKRQAVRTPMQWTGGRNGGFSRAAPSRLAATPPADGYAPEHVSVEAQMHDPDSLLAAIRGFVARYRSSPEIGWGAFELLEVGEPAVLAHRITEDHLRFVALHNFAPRPVRVTLELGDVPDGAVLSDLFAVDADPIDDRGRVDVELDAYGYRWFRVLAPGDRRLT